MKLGFRAWTGSDFSPADQPKPIWEGIVEIEEDFVKNPRDPREMLDYFLIAPFEHFLEDTGGALMKPVLEVKRIRREKGLEPEP